MVAVGSCAPAPQPQPLPPASPPPLVVIAPPLLPALSPAPTGDWDEQPIIAGNWAYDAARRRARFVDDSGLERASLTCTAAGRTVRLALVGETAAAAELLTSAGRTPWILSDGAVDLGIADGALDRMAFSRGRFGVRGTMLFVLPVQAEIGRVIEDCRG